MNTDITDKYALGLGQSSHYMSQPNKQTDDPSQKDIAAFQQASKNQEAQEEARISEIKAKISALITQIGQLTQQLGTIDNGGGNPAERSSLLNKIQSLTQQLQILQASL